MGPKLNWGGGKLVVMGGVHVQNRPPGDRWGTESGWKGGNSMGKKEGS